MKTLNHLISIQTLTDYHLESFISCPYKFYYQYILRKKSGEDKWRQMVQFSVNKIIREYYQLPLNEQNKMNLLKLIDHYCGSIHPGLFENKIHYYISLAKVTDHLLLLLTSKKRNQPLLFLYERFQTSVEEIGTKISLTIDIGEWCRNTFCIKKYLLDADESIVDLYKYLIIIFSKKAFGVLPDQIELMSLLNGKCHLIHPTEQDVTNGFMYLEYVKNQIEKPNHYFKKNGCNSCSECTFKKECDFYEIQKEHNLNISLKTVTH